MEKPEGSLNWGRGEWCEATVMQSVKEACASVILGTLKDGSAGSILVKCTRHMLLRERARQVLRKQKILSLLLSPLSQTNSVSVMTELSGQILLSLPLFLLCPS